MLPVFSVSYGIAKCKREITRGSVMCHYLMTNKLIYDTMNTLYNSLSHVWYVQVCIRGRNGDDGWCIIITWAWWWCIVIKSFGHSLFHSNKIDKWSVNKTDLQAWNFAGPTVSRPGTRSLSYIKPQQLTINRWLSFRWPYKL